MKNGCPSAELHFVARSPFQVAVECEHQIDRAHHPATIIVAGHGVAQTCDWHLSAAMCRAALTPTRRDLT